MMLTRLETAAATPLAMEAAAAPALRVENLAKSFRKARALKAVSFDVPEAAMTVLLGPAGAGKTTTLRLIAGFDRPDGGSIVMRGRDLAGLEPKARDLAMIFDNLALYPEKTGLENLLYPLKLRGLAPAAALERAKEMAQKLRIPHVLNRLPKTMSGGERQRVALGRALVRDPALFLLDEPLSSLDALLRLELRAELKRLQREQGRTFLLATPDYAEALAIADRVVMLVSGEVRQIAAPQTLYDDPADRDVARFVGAPEINLFPAEYDPAEDGRIRIADSMHSASQALRSAFAAAPASFEAALRPEHIVIGAPASSGLSGRVFDVEPLGLQSAVTLDIGAATLRATVPGEQGRALGIGQTVGLTLAADRLMAFDLETGRRLA